MDVIEQVQRKDEYAYEYTRIYVYSYTYVQHVCTYSYVLGTQGIINSMYVKIKYTRRTE